MEDLNQSFYLVENIECDFEETQEYFEKLRISDKKTNTGLSPEKLLSEAVGRMFKERSCFKKCRGCGNLKNVFEMRNHEKRCKSKKQLFGQLTDTEMLEFKCSSCSIMFSRRSGLRQHRNNKLCTGGGGGGGDGVMVEDRVEDIYQVQRNYRRPLPLLTKPRKRCQTRGVWSVILCFIDNNLVTASHFQWWVQEVKQFKWSVTNLLPQFSQSRISTFQPFHDQPAD